MIAQLVAVPDASPDTTGYAAPFHGQKLKLPVSRVETTLYHQKCALFPIIWNKVRTWQQSTA